MMKKLLLSMAALALMASGMTTASASHPTMICLELDADTRHGTSNDDIIDTQHAYVGATDDGHPQEQEGCVLEEGSNFGGTQIDFEVTGVADPDESNSPETPDRSCTVQDGFNSCFVEVPPSSGGEQTIRAWIDLDKNNETVEADLAEGYDEEAEPGAAEPDATDVSLWTWTHGDPPPPPCDTGSCPSDSAVSISYRRSRGIFHGEVLNTDWHGCRAGRVVKLWKRRSGPDRLKMKTTTDDDGIWKMRGFGSAHGRHYVTTPQKYSDIPGSEPPARYDCLKARSRVLDLR